MILTTKILGNKIINSTINLDRLLRFEKNVYITLLLNFIYVFYNNHDFEKMMDLISDYMDSYWLVVADRNSNSF